MKKSYFVFSLILWVYLLLLLAVCTYHLDYSFISYFDSDLESFSYYTKLCFILGILFYSIFDFICTIFWSIFYKIKNKIKSKSSKESEA